MGTGIPDEAVKKFYEELCSNLNLNKEAEEEAWNSYSGNYSKYSLEGNQHHWLACALYVACRKPRGDQQIDGNCVPLMQLLRSCKISLVIFLEKAKKWCDMSDLGAEYRDRLNRIERNYAVSMVIFKKYRPIFMDLFQRPIASPDKNQPGRARKPRNTMCTTGQLFDFTWTLFVMAKSRIPDILDDLVNSYHLLLVCCDMVFANTLIADRKDLVNPQFMGLPANYHDEDYIPPHEAPCILSELIRSHDGIILEAKGIRDYWWNNLIDRLIEKNVFKGELSNRSGILDGSNFDVNFKAVNKEYEEFVHNRGDFDERTFLNPEADSEIGSPTKESDFFEKMQERKLIKQTPLTGQYISKLEPGCRVSPVSTAVESISKLQEMLANRSDGPSKALQLIFQSCNDKPEEAIKQRVKDLGDLFITKYTEKHGEIPGSHLEFARKRLQLGVTLYYMILEVTTVNEQQKKGNSSVPVLLENDKFHKSLFACCLEIVLYSYNSQRKFPWILEALEVEPYYFYKVIEIMVIAIFDKLSRGTIKNLQFIEDQILECLVWAKSSPLWREIDALNRPLPTYEEVKLPDDVGNLSPTRGMTSAVKRLIGKMPGTQFLLSPNPKKKLFTDQSGSTKAGQSILQTSGGGKYAINIQTIQGHDGQKYIPIQYVQNGNTVIIQGQTSAEEKKPRMTGSLALFLRKFYYMTSLRLKALCKMLNLDEVETQKIWTNLEHSITHHPHSLLMDRHIDQLIMCAIYVVCKVTNKNREFKTIMHHYRDLPQSASSVYRDVMIEPATPDQQIEEKRGDLIKFYNTVYVIHMKEFSVKFSEDPSIDLILSPLPTAKSQQMSPKLKLTEKSNVYVSNLGKGLVDPQNRAVGTLAYYFSRSPVETLRQINSMVSESPTNTGGKVGKRLFEEATQFIITTDSPPAKKPNLLNTGVARKIQNMLEDRKQTTQ